jgi:hypothetical protein
MFKVNLTNCQIFYTGTSWPPHRRFEYSINNSVDKKTDKNSADKKTVIGNIFLIP